MRTVVGAVLAGGAGRRMGGAKEGVLLPDGRPMLAHTLETLRAACGRVVVVGACAGMSLEVEPDVLHVLDETPGEGPLAGLVSLLACCHADAYLLAACDQPLLTPTLLRRLLNASPERPAFFRAADGAPLDPFPGYFPAALLPAARAAFRAGERSLRRFAKGQNPAWLPLSSDEQALLRDFDTPDDLAALADRR